MELTKTGSYVAFVSYIDIKKYLKIIQHTNKKNFVMLIQNFSLWSWQIFWLSRRLVLSLSCIGIYVHKLNLCWPVLTLWKWNAIFFILTLFIKFSWKESVIYEKKIIYIHKISNLFNNHNFLTRKLWFFSICSFLFIYPIYL